MGKNSNTTTASNKTIAKPGYKYTPLGWIPEEWKIVDLGIIANIKRGRFSPRPRNDPKYYGGTIPFVQTSDVTTSNGRINSYNQTLNEAGLKVSVLFPAGTILMTIASNVGHSAILDIAMACPDSLVGIICRSNIDTNYLNYFFHFNQRRIEYIAPGAQKNINIEFLEPLPIVCPEYAEQCKISLVITTWDDCINKTQQLIEQLKLRNKGLMQELLTGRRRLKEFEHLPWAEYHISEISKEVSLKNKQGEQLTVLSCTKYDGLVPSLEYFGRRVFGNDTSTYKIVPKYHFAYATNHIEEGSIGYQSQLIKALISPMYTVFKTKEIVFDDYLYRLLKSHFYIHEYKRRMEGSIDRRGGLRWDEFSKIKVLLPSLEEQKSINVVLYKADCEVSSNELLLRKLLEQKKGLMQKLLTGEIRVNQMSQL